METDWFLEDMREWMINNPEVDHVKENCLIKKTGFPHTEEYKRNASIRMMGNKHTLGIKCKPEHVAIRAAKKRKPVMVQGIYYESGRHAAKALGISPSMIIKMLKSGKASYAGGQ